MSLPEPKTGEMLAHVGERTRVLLASKADRKGRYQVLALAQPGARLHERLKERLPAEALEALRIVSNIAEGYVKAAVGNNELLKLYVMGEVLGDVRARPIMEEALFSRLLSSRMYAVSTTPKGLRVYSYMSLFFKEDDGTETEVTFQPVPVNAITIGPPRAKR